MRMMRTWNLRRMDQGKPDMVKREMEHLNMAVLDVSELKRTGMEHLQWSNYKVFYSGNDKFRRDSGIETKCSTGSLETMMQGLTESY